MVRSSREMTYDEISAPLLFGSSHLRKRQVARDWPDSDETGGSRRLSEETASGMVAGVWKLTCSL